jgi:DNA-binding MarR family transcriptional regulator
MTGRSGLRRATTRKPNRSFSAGQCSRVSGLVVRFIGRAARRTGRGRGGLTRLLDRMERDGLVRRTVSVHDRRRFDVTLTPDGRRRFDQVWPEHADGIGRYFVQPLAGRDLGELGRILDTLIQANEEEPG